MPLPTPNEGETEQEFISRCMGNETIRSDFDTQEQRAALCYSQWRKNKAVDPAVGGGVDREKLKDSDFVFPDTRTFPVVTPGDVSDAVSSWGRYRGRHSFEEFKRRLIALCKRKGSSFVSALPQEWKDEMSKALQAEELVAYGGPLKTLGKGKVGGYLVRYSGDTDPDLEDDFFTAETWYGPHKTTPVFYHHGEDGTLRLKRLADEAEIVDDEFGKWVEAQLSLRDRYEQWIYGQAEDGKMGWSSGTAPHLVEREPVGNAWWIKTWPLGIDATMTLAPAEPRNRVVTYKTYLKGLSDALGVWLADEARAGTEPEDGPPSASVASDEQRYFFIIGG